jgi:hypothetical protein
LALLHFEHFLIPLLCRSAEPHHLLALLHLLARGLLVEVGFQPSLEGIRYIGSRRADPAENILTRIYDR